MTSYAKIVEKKESLTSWFREGETSLSLRAAVMCIVVDLFSELGMGKYLDDKECQRRVNEAKVMQEEEGQPDPLQLLGMVMLLRRPYIKRGSSLSENWRLRYQKSC